MTKTDQLNRIYHGKRIMFDTALPDITINNVIDELHPQADRGTEERGKLYATMCQAVYAYGSRGKEGFIPLTNECRMMIQRFLEKTGVNLFFIPTVEDLRRAS